MYNNFIFVMHKVMDCSLIICTYNWPEALKLVLSSALFQSVEPNEIIIADDGSSKTTAIVIEDLAKSTSIPIIHSWQKDNGCRISHSRNRAIAKSNFEYIIMIDGDTVLHYDFIKDHKRFACKKVYIQGSRALLQSKLTSKILSKSEFSKPVFFSEDSKNKINLLRLPLISKLMSYIKNQNLNRIRGCNYSIFREDILEVNGFNEKITTWGREDSEFVQRLFNNGVKKQHLKFSGIQYHLYHDEKSHNSINDNILKDTILKNSIWCKSGIDGYFK
jgi:glycosyltransferase involved in cell wall biosynthesis